MISFRIGILATCLSATACLDGGPRGVDLGEIEPLDPPLGEGSLWPGLSTHGDKVVLSWQESDDGDAWTVKTAMLGDAGWGPALTVASSTEERGFFVNWADFASVEILEPDLLERSPPN